MAVALAPDQAIFDNISLVRIGARFMDDRQECIRWCRQWIFGGYDPATKEGFLLPVPRRNAATLMPLIIQWVRPGTEIWSDMWGAYNVIAAPGFQQDVVNHQYNFVDPNTRVTTNHVEAMWQRAKAKFKSMFGPTNRDMIPDYLAEFMWNQRFKEHSYFHFWSQVTQQYPV